MSYSLEIALPAQTVSATVDGGQWESNLPGMAEVLSGACEGLAGDPICPDPDRAAAVAAAGMLTARGIASTVAPDPADIEPVAGRVY